MSESKRKNSNGAVDQIIGNMTSDIQNADGQYIQLGFTPPSSPDNISWNMQNQPTQSPFLPHYTLPNPESKLGYPVEQQYKQPPFGFIQQPGIFANDVYESQPFEAYQNGASDAKMFTGDYNLFLQNDGLPHHSFAPHENLNDLSSCAQNRTQLIENLVGNWAVPNTTGTYSPFGNAQFVPNISIFEPLATNDSINCNGISKTPEEPDILQPKNTSGDEVAFQFNHDIKKPRIVAEVKPMRPSYSDVLTKSAPQTTLKTSKTENKENKQKRDNKKFKSEKVSKANNVLNRSNTNSEIKDIPNEKFTTPVKNNDKSLKNSKTNQLNRKWVSLDNVAETSEELKVGAQKNKKTDDASNSSKNAKNPKKVFKNVGDITDTDSGSNKNESSNINKSAVKKGIKGQRQKSYDSFANNERPPGKRGQRIRKRDSHVPFGFCGQILKQYILRWWKLFVYFIFWLVNLVSDICSLSVHLGQDVICVSWKWLVIHWALFLENSRKILQRIRILTWIWDKIKCKKQPDENSKSSQPGLQHNINMPTTGEEAMKRLLACKGKDPYSILGVVPTCTDDDIKRYYKRQAFLVHPDKNQQPGAEEAFKILVHAFDMIGEPERRATYDRGLAESAQAEQEWTELTELLAQLQQKVEAAANTIRCSACNLRHKRIKVDRPSYAARNCSTCKIHHSAREGDIWAEAQVFGFLWHYYACMEGGVYDITEWAGCQKDSLKHLRPDSHHVQYRIALGKQNNQSRRHSSSPRGDRPPDLEHLLNSLYGQTDNSQNMRRKNKKNK